MGSTVGLWLRLQTWGHSNLVLLATRVMKLNGDQGEEKSDLLLAGSSSAALCRGRGVLGCRRRDPVPAEDPEREAAVGQGWLKGEQKRPSQRTPCGTSGAGGDFCERFLGGDSWA